MNITSIIHLTKDVTETKKIVQEELTNGTNYFIAVGGDGTVNLLASLLIHTEAILGIVPRGSGNGLARHLHIPKDIHRAIVKIMKRRIKTIDAIQINDHYAFNVAGIGFDGYISTLFGQNGKRGLRNYMKLIQKEYLQYKPIEVSILDKKTPEKKNVITLAFANGSQYGNNALIAPHAKEDDAFMETVSIQKIPFAFLPAFFVRVLSGKILSSKYVSSTSNQSLKIKTNTPVHFHTDGDGKGITDTFEVSVIKNCLKIFY